MDCPQYLDSTYQADLDDRPWKECEDPNTGHRGTTLFHRFEAVMC